MKKTLSKKSKGESYEEKLDAQIEKLMKLSKKDLVKAVAKLGKKDPMTFLNLLVQITIREKEERKA